MEKISREDFEKKVLQCTAPVVVDFYADWCMPCRTLAPTLEEVSRELAGDVRFVKVNVDDDASLANHYGVMSVPTVMLFEKGTERDRFVGALSKGQVERFVSQSL